MRYASVQDLRGFLRGWKRPRLQLEHRAKLRSGKDMVVPEGDVPGAILVARVNIEGHNELMRCMLVWKLFC